LEIIWQTACENCEPIWWFSRVARRDRYFGCIGCYI